MGGARLHLVAPSRKLDGRAQSEEYQVCLGNVRFGNEGEMFVCLVKGRYNVGSIIWGRGGK